MSSKMIHMIGIGGVGMAGLAVLLKARGNEVTGCDLRETPRTRFLASLGIPVSFGHDPAHLADDALVIATPAARLTAEFAAAEKSGRLRMRGEVLAEIVSACDSIAVCGSHGKTTTSTWTAKLLLSLGEDVSWCIGGETGAFPVAHAGKGPLVVEADESDGTLALYRARTLVVTNCDYDHPDHFPTRADYVACYDAARHQAADVIEGEGLAPLDLSSDPVAAAAFAALPAHNRQNARAAIEVALRRGHSLAAILAVLPAVVSELPDRRFQRLSEGVYTDYAHHPVEMRCAIEMARSVCRGTLRVLFQPHRYSRTKALLHDFPNAFESADELVLCPTYAAFEKPVEGGDIADLYREVRTRLPALSVRLARSCTEAWEHAVRSRANGDLTLLLGAGDLISIAGTPPSLPRRFWIGNGSNTWKSDLNLAVEYVRTSGRADVSGASLGIPWMAGIPGTVGGWIKMNAGAFGHSISEVLARVKVDGRWIDAADCGFSYRHSNISGEIQDFELRKDLAFDASAADFLARRKVFPPGTFGSFFKNPPGDFAGRLLEAAGAKELCVGGAYVWSEHANVIVRGPDATPSDVLALARLMRNAVFFRFGLSLEPEVQGIEL